MPLFKVTMFGAATGDQVNAVALVEAETIEDAHGLGVKRIREAHPEADPALYDLTLAHEILWRHPTE